MRMGFEMLLAELQSSRLEVALVPCRYEVNVGGCVRVAISKNCTWYRQFCTRHQSSRSRKNAAPDTRIKRRNVERLLERLIEGRPVRSKYAEELQRLAARYLAMESVA